MAEESAEGGLIGNLFSKGPQGGQSPEGRAPGVGLPPDETNPRIAERLERIKNMPPSEPTPVTSERAGITTEGTKVPAEQPTTQAPAASPEDDPNARIAQLEAEIESLVAWTEAPDSSPSSRSQDAARIEALREQLNNLRGRSPQGPETTKFQPGGALSRRIARGPTPTPGPAQPSSPTTPPGTPGAPGK